jgi:16S rRNA (cytosine1407-C5)-methyltransferase
MTRKKHPTSRHITAAPEAQQQAIERFRALLNPADFADLIAELQRPLPQGLRVNPLKETPSNTLPDWQKRYHWQVEPIPFCSTGWRLLETETAPSQTIEHRMGLYYLQDAASMLPVELFNLPEDCSNLLILDMAASPGGKTTHLSSRMNDHGLLLANDSSQGRIPALRVVLQNWGSANQAITCFPGEKFGAWFPEAFDRILLDAPCSMQNLRSTESHPMRAEIGRAHV